ncbi:MAG: DUF1192 domain-containing protein [Hyphomicrobiaceae bacterium]
MDWDEPLKSPKRTIVVGEDLSALSVAELQARIATLNEEIERIGREITSKKAHTNAADALFKRS